MSIYPSNPIWDDNQKFKSGVISAVKHFKRNYPYSVGYDARKAGMIELMAKLNAIYSMNTKLEFICPDRTDSTSSCFAPWENKITMVGKLSLITFLHEFTHARLGHSEFTAVKWSLSLFKRCFPRAFADLTANRHCLMQ